MNCLIGKPFEIKRVLNASVANVIVSVLLGKRFDYEDPQFLRLLTLIGENIKLIGNPSIVVTVSSLFDLFSLLDSSVVHLIVQETVKRMSVCSKS